MVKKAAVKEKEKEKKAMAAKPVTKPAAKAVKKAAEKKPAAAKAKPALKKAAVKKPVNSQLTPSGPSDSRSKERGAVSRGVKAEAPKVVIEEKKKVVPPREERPAKLKEEVKIETPKPKMEVSAPAPAPKPAAPEKVPEIKEEPAPEVIPAKPVVRTLELSLPISLKELAQKIGVKSNELIVNLMARNVFATINQSLGEEIVKDILAKYGFEYRFPAKAEDQMSKEHRDLEDKQDVRHIAVRSPVVTFMGHVDHGKTSLLDFIRKTRVADKEKGGITQHIGAYEVKFKKGSVTFLDTPGHEAFTAMRARGANATDIVVLVVAADDGVMPQTKEAIDHARAAGVTIVVAINKCDLPTANLDKVKGQLSQVGLSPEDWGGKTIAVPVSAKTGEGVDHLLEMLILEAELLELKANPHLRARGVVIEGKLSSGQGPVATVLVKNGTLRTGDMALSGMYYGRVKAMMNDKLERVTEAGPSKPVTILGLSGVPMAGDEFFVVKDEKKARILSVLKQDEERSRKLKLSRRVTLEGFYSQMKDGVAKELVIVLKGDVQGSVEAIQESLKELSAKDVNINIIHADVGNINESDVMLAVVSNAVVIGFNVKVDDNTRELASKEGIDIKVYGIIYEALQDVVAAMEGLLEPVMKEVFVGRAIVKQAFKVSKVGTIAGCQVSKGKIARSGMTKLVRNKIVIFQGKISSLKRFKDDVREVNEGVECGIGLDRHDDIKEGDVIEQYQIEKVARRLEARK